MGRRLIGIHTAGSERGTVASKVADYGLEYPIVIDSHDERGNAWGELFDKFAVRQIPTTIVVDRNGKIVAHAKLEEMLVKAGVLAGEKPGGR